MTFFLNDPESTWWKYHEDAMKAGLVDYETNDERLARYNDQVLQDVRSEVSGSAWTEEQILEEHRDRMGKRHLVEYPDPSTLEGSMEMVKTSYEYGNQYESNPPVYSDYEGFERVQDHAYYPDVTSTKDLVMPRYARWVHDTARELQVRDETLGLNLAEAHRSHYSSLILFSNKYTHKVFASYYFPPEDPLHLPNYGTPSR